MRIKAEVKENMQSFKTVGDSVTGDIMVVAEKPYASGLSGVQVGEVFVNIQGNIFGFDGTAYGRKWLLGHRGNADSIRMRFLKPGESVTLTALGEY